MPKPYELPRRKVESSRSKKEFEAKKEQLRIAKILNSTPPKGEPKPNPMGHQPVPPDPLSKALQTVVQSLSTAHPLFAVNPADFLKEAPPWRGKTQLYCLDLAGYWNDVRHEIGVRAGGADLKANDVALLGKALDWLELADLGGGMSAWLERWKGQAKEDQPNWDEAKAAAEGIEKSITFALKMLDHNLELLTPQGQHLGIELAHAIEAIGFEISRQIGEVVASRKLKSDELLAVKDRLGAKNRAGMPYRLRDALLEKHKLKEACKEELPVSMRKDEKIDAILRTAAMWHVEALEFRKFANAPNVIDVDPGKEAELVRNLDKTAAAVAEKLADVANWDPPNDPKDYFSLNPSRYNQVRMTMVELAKTIYHETNQLASKIVNPVARTALMEGLGQKNLDAAITKINSKDGRTTSIYRDVAGTFIDLQNRRTVLLGALWRGPYKYLAEKLNDKNTPGHDKALAKEFEKKFGDCGLAELMDGWAASKSNETYQRAWELLAKLRELKASAADVFKGDSPLAQQSREFLDIVFDAVSAELANDVDQAYRGTT